MRKGHFDAQTSKETVFPPLNRIVSEMPEAAAMILPPESRAPGGNLRKPHLAPISGNVLWEITNFLMALSIGHQREDSRAL